MLNKKMGCSVVAIALSCSMLFAGCGSDKKTDSSSNTGTSTSTEEQKDPTRLIWYGYNTVEKDHDMVMSELNKYLAEKINVSLEANFLAGDDFKTKVPILLSSGQQVDMVFTSSWMNPYGTLAMNGTITPLDDLLKENGKEALAMFDDKIWEGTKINGKIYGIPSYKDIASAHYVYFNKDMVEKYKMDVSNVKTFEDLTPLLKTIKEKEPSMLPVNVQKENAYNYTPFDHISGVANLPGSLLKEGGDTKIFNELAHPEFLRVAKVMREWYKAGLINPNAPIQTDMFINEYKSGKVFARVNQSIPSGYLADEAAYSLKLIEKELVSPAMGSVSAIGAMQSIPSNSKYKVEAMKVLNLFASDTYVNNLLRFGIEGTHYKKVDDKTLTLLPEGITAGDSKYYLKRAWPFGNMTLTLLPKGENPTKWEELKKFNEKALLTPSFGFSFNDEKVATEIAACKSVWDEFVPSILCGTVDPEEYIAKANAKLDKAGIKKVIAEIQTQYDAYLATKK